jgi:hypothetical protein
MVTPSSPAVLSFTFGHPPPTFTDKLAERTYLKERLACAFRVLAKEGLCECAGGWGCGCGVCPMLTTGDEDEQVKELRDM